MRAGSYVWTVLVGFDRFCAAVFFNQGDFTVSGLCDIVRLQSPGLGALRLSPWQHWFLVRCGKGLEWIQPGHCAQARLTDQGSAQRTIDLLKL
jgi:hypothetical protein